MNNQFDNQQQNTVEQNQQVNPNPVQQPNQFNPYYVQQAKPLGMKWYKWLMVVLIIGAVFEVSNAIRSFTGMDYSSIAPGFTAADMYAICEGLQTWDILLGVFCLIIAALQIFARVTLGKYKKIGPMLLYVTYAASIVFNLVYTFGAMSTIPSESVRFGFYIIKFTPETIVSTAIGSVVVSAVILILNIVYFNKRKHLFVN